MFGLSLSHSSIHSIRVRPDVQAALAVAAVSAAPVRVTEASAALLEEMRALAAAYAERWAGRQPAEIAALAPARTLYRAFGIDPTRHRPSSEALVRRVLKDRPLPRVSNAVDLCNLLALRFMLPLGLYDVACIDGPVEIRRGRPGESFAGIRKGDVHVSGRPVVADVTGAFGNPSSDSLRTAVGPTTTSLLLVIFAAAGTDPATLAAHAATACAAMRQHLPSPRGENVDARRVDVG